MPTTIPCSQCNGGLLRLLRFEGSRGIWACRQCGYETRLLDCHTCERTLIRRLGRNAAGCGVWACVNCRQPKLACPHCAAGWLEAAGNGLRCAHCGSRWPDQALLAETAVVGP